MSRGSVVSPGARGSGHHLGRTRTPLGNTRPGTEAKWAPSHTCAFPLPFGAPRTSVLSQGLEVNGDVMLLAGQRAGLTLQIISVARILSDPLDFVAAIRFCCELGNGALSRMV